MVIVNPYLKKKKPITSLSAGAGKNTASRRATTSFGPASATKQNGYRPQPSRVTPNGKKPIATNSSRENVANKPHVSPPSSSTKGQRLPNVSRNTRISAATRPLNGKALSVKRSSKSKLSVKQRLKQEIAALKKQKQLQKLQKEADERRRRRMAEKKAEEDRRMAFLAAKEEERRQKQAERERIATLKQEERVRKQQERERKQREKELERERKREEKVRKEQERRLLLEQRMEERKQKAEEKYRRDLQAWENHHQRWVEQQQRIHLMQQTYQLQQGQFNYPLPSLQQMQYRPQIYQNHYAAPSNQIQTVSPPQVSTPQSQSQSQLHLQPKPAETQQQNEQEISRGADSTPDTSVQKTPSSPLSPLDSSTALALDTLMKSDLFSSPTQLETVKSPLSNTDEKEMAVANDSNAIIDKALVRNFVTCCDEKEKPVSTITTSSTQPEISDNKNEMSVTTDSVATIDTRVVRNDNSLATHDIQNNRSEEKNEATNHTAPDSANLSTHVDSNDTMSANSNMTHASQPSNKHLQPANIPSSSLIFSQQKNSQQQYSRPTTLPHSFNNTSKSHSSTGYGSMHPNYMIPTNALATAPYLQPMMNNAFMNPGFSAMTGYLSWVPPPPPRPRPPILSQPKALRQVSSMVQRAKAPKPTAPPLLCSPMEAPSPFASQDRYLVTIMVIRDPRTEKSFGVNLQLHTQSALVDPEWLEEQKLKQKPKVERNEDSTRISSAQTKLSPTINRAVVSAPLYDKQSPMSSSDPLPPQKIGSDGTSAKNSLDVEVEVKGSESEIEESMQKVPQTCTTNDGLSGSKSTDQVKPDINTRDTVKKCLEDLVNSVVEKTTPGIPKTVRSAQRRKRRRRVNFSVMQVMDAIKQNSRRPDVDAEKKLQPGDIVISVQGNNLNGMTFKDACGVFSQKAVSVSDSLIETKVIVARKKAAVTPVIVPSAEKPKPDATTSAVAPAPTKTPAEAPVVAPQLPENTSMIFSHAEIASISNSFFQTLHSSSRVLGLDIQDSAWHFHSVIFRMGLLLKETELTPRTSIILKNKWSHLTRFIDYNLVEKGKAFWDQHLRQEFGDEKIPFSSDVERHARRHLPRPSKGCRCGQNDHEYVFDPKCTLYRDLHKRLSTEELVALRQQKKKKKKSSVLDKELNMVESAFKNRIIKLKAATENESIEARFVEKMEEIQVKELHQAVFAPNLTTIVLSTIFELQREFDVPMEDDDEKANDHDDDDDDDIALDSLGKRKSQDQTENDAKKQHKLGREGDPNISLKYLVRMLEYVSKTWGHCYREPERDDYAWRWELFHAVHSNYDQWDAHAMNPRTPGSFTFENVRFGLSDSKSISDRVSSLPKRIREFEDSIVSGSPSSLDVSNDILDQFCMVLHLLSPSRTGLYDEVLALLKMGVFKVSRTGIPLLTEDWWTKIDIVVLDEMLTSWSTKVDPDSRHCVNEELRDTLEEKWVKNNHGWSLLENRDELIFDFAILDEWRETFEGRLEEKANQLEGIGRFGL